MVTVKRLAPATEATDATDATEAPEATDAAEAAEAAEATDAADAADAAKETEATGVAAGRAGGVKGAEDAGIIKIEEADEESVVLTESIVSLTTVLSRVEKRVTSPVAVESVVSVPVATRQDTIPVTSLEIESKSLDPALTTRWLHVDKVSLPHCNTRYASPLGDSAGTKISSCVLPAHFRNWKSK
jgi:hypothetical protein